MHLFTRRRTLAGVAAALAAPSAWAAAAGRKPLFRYAICNETFEKMPFAESCKLAKRLGYEGLEIAPFTLADSVDDISAARRRELADIMRSEGVAFAGLHWLLLTPKWLHITTGEASVRQRSWEYFRKLLDFCGDLGEGGVMVLGSPKQRGSRGIPRAEAHKHLTAGLAAVAPAAAARKATICLEPLDGKQTDVVNTLAEAAAIVREIKHPAVQTMFDYHNTGDETEPHDRLVRRYLPMIRHIHINEMDGRHPGTGGHDFAPVLRALRAGKYRGWVSLEVFDFKLGAERIGREAMEHLRKVEARLAST
jgi:sugar phosphate isomerase/epimerase